MTPGERFTETMRGWPSCSQCSNPLVYSAREVGDGLCHPCGHAAHGRLAGEIEQLRQDVAALKAWRDSATGCEDVVVRSSATFGGFDYDTKVITLSAEEMRLIEESPDCGEWTKDENGEQIQASPPRSDFHGCTVDRSLFERNQDGSVKQVDGKPVPKLPADPSEGDRLMAFFKGE